ncbi:MAG: hypothetical protein GX352_01360 [Clostridiales bacterium]|nr:hypothetical protein [Clostridiales bacterium]
MSRKIILATTGERSSPNYTIVDQGEGQSPDRMPSTILSIGKSNKLRIPFVQGKFNMGGTGVLQFCGKNNLQLVITKRCPRIPADDPSHEMWGLTIVRREDPSEGRRSSMYTYLTGEDGKIIRFYADTLPITPMGQNKHAKMEYGMFIKLFNYDNTGYKTNLLFDFNYRLSLLMPDLAHPIRLIECRDYKGHSLETTLSGLSIRLLDDRNENLDAEFDTASSGTFSVNQQLFKYSIYVFKEIIDQGKKKRPDENYRENEGVLFTINGQTHGYLSKTFFKRKRVNLSYISDSILLLVDCSAIDGRTREDLFMNSRDRLRKGDLKKKIEENLEEILKQHSGLRALQEKRRRDAISRQLDDEKPLADVLSKILKGSPTLSKLFLTGGRLPNPFKLTGSENESKFRGNLHPTFFVLEKKPQSGAYVKRAPKNHRFRIQFKTDAVNDYFNRTNDPGTFKLYCNDTNYDNYSMNLFNGVISITVNIPINATVGEEFSFKAEILDDCIPYDLTDNFILRVEDEAYYKGGGNGKRKKPGSSRKGTKNTRQDRLSLPEVIELNKSDWMQHDIDQNTALIVKRIDEVYDFYINIDNVHLNTEIKGIRDENRPALIKARYKYSMVLIGLSILNYYKDNRKQDEQDDDFDIESQIKDITAMVSPIILPMIQSMGELDIHNITPESESISS